MMSDASEMLAAALEQMDGIIAGKGLPLYLTTAPALLLNSTCQTRNANVGEVFSTSREPPLSLDRVGYMQSRFSSVIVGLVCTVVQ